MIFILRHITINLYVYIYNLIAWWILEERFDGICDFLRVQFGSYFVRERQLSKMRIEISAYEGKSIYHSYLK